MKTILYMAATLNGFIAKTDDDTSWISQEEWSSYSEIVRRAGNVIIGHRTYDILTKQPEFSEFADVKVVVVSDQHFPTLSPNHRIASSPQEALKSLRGFEEVILAGGSILNAAFLKENLVDELFIDIEPIIFGEGIPLFASSDFESKLQLLETKYISENEIQLHYAVLR